MTKQVQKAAPRTTLSLSVCNNSTSFSVIRTCVILGSMHFLLFLLLQQQQQQQHSFAMAATTTTTAAGFKSLPWSMIQQPKHYNPRNNIITAFAAASKGGNKKKKKKKGGNGMKNPSGGFGKSTTSTTTKQPRLDFSTPQKRMSYIQSQIQSSNYTSLLHPTTTTTTNPNSFCIIDNFLGSDFLSTLRSEAQSLLPTMIPSQSTKWDDATQSVVSYQKHNVLSTQIEGGEVGYAKTPRLVEYVVTMTQYLSAEINKLGEENNGGVNLSNLEQTNKLAVCLGDGSKYDKHIDNMGGDDRRKLTALLYLQDPSLHSSSSSSSEDDIAADPNNLGGHFRAYDVPTEGEVTSISPKGDRLLLFWSDSLVHDVAPSFAPGGKDEQRWALTIWFLTDSVGNIRVTDEELAQRHFGTG